MTGQCPDAADRTIDAAGRRAMRADALPGYRRRIRIEPGACSVRALLEDDIHCMQVTLSHADGQVTGIDAKMLRAPWSTCPGAEAQLAVTFAGKPLAQVTARVDKQRNCTHLHDLAVLAAAHAADRATSVYDVLVSDPLAGERILELHRDGVALLRWIERDGVLVAPPALAGATLLQLRDRIAALPAACHEAARMLQWAALVAHGRTIPLAAQSDATAMGPVCYTFQPERALVARRIGDIVDFSCGSRVPLAGIDARDNR